jgi:hypothetical protein
VRDETYQSQNDQLVYNLPLLTRTRGKRWVGPDGRSRFRRQSRWGELDVRRAFVLLSRWVIGHLCGILNPFPNPLQIGGTKSRARSLPRAPHCRSFNARTEAAVGAVFNSSTNAMGCNDIGVSRRRHNSRCCTTDKLLFFGRHGLPLTADGKLSGRKDVGSGKAIQNHNI